MQDSFLLWLLFANMSLKFPFPLQGFEMASPRSYSEVLCLCALQRACDLAATADGWIGTGCVC